VQARHDSIILYGPNINRQGDATFPTECFAFWGPRKLCFLWAFRKEKVGKKKLFILEDQYYNACDE
jgi:hypothetical protein